MKFISTLGRCDGGSKFSVSCSAQVPNLRFQETEVWHLGGTAPAKEGLGTCLKNSKAVAFARVAHIHLARARRAKLGERNLPHVGFCLFGGLYRLLHHTPELFDGPEKDFSCAYQTPIHRGAKQRSSQKCRPDMIT